MYNQLIAQINGVSPLFEMLQITHPLNHDDALKRLIRRRQISGPFTLGEAIEIANLTLIGLVHKPSQQIEITIAFFLSEFQNPVVPLL